MSPANVSGFRAVLQVGEQRAFVVIEVIDQRSAAALGLWHGLQPWWRDRRPSRMGTGRGEENSRCRGSDSRSY